MDFSKIARQSAVLTEPPKASSSELVEQVPSAGISGVADSIEPGVSLNPVAQNFLENGLAELPDLVKADLRVVDQIGQHQHEDRLGTTGSGLDFNLPDLELPEDSAFSDRYGNLFGFDPEHDLRIGRDEAGSMTTGGWIVTVGAALFAAAKEGAKEGSKLGPGGILTGVAVGVAVALAQELGGDLIDALIEGGDNYKEPPPPDSEQLDGGVPLGVPEDPAKTPIPDGQDEGSAILQPWQTPYKIFFPALDPVDLQEFEPSNVLRSHDQAVDGNPDAADFEPTTLAASELPGFGYVDPTVDGILNIEEKG